jgi:hypothetical protein
MNPFAVTNSTPNESGVFGDATRVRSNFLYRVIQLGPPLNYRVVYDGWWFRQRIEINGVLAWSRISWLTIQRRVEFRVPVEVAPYEPAGRIEIEFTRGLMVRRFRLWIGESLVYDEIN